MICRTNSNQFEFVQQIAVTKFCRNDDDFHMSHEAICCSNLSRRFVASCVSAFKDYQRLSPCICVFSKTRLLPELRRILSCESPAVFLHTPLEEKGSWGLFYQLRQMLKKGRHLLQILLKAPRVVSIVVVGLGTFSQRALSHSWKTLQDLFPDPAKKHQNSPLVGCLSNTGHNHCIDHTASKSY